MTFLLDINVIIALIDPAHLSHGDAHEWFAMEGQRSWATCPLTQNGVLRIVGHPSYPNSPGTPAAVAPLLAEMIAIEGHVFWPDDISLLSATSIQTSRLLGSSQITDSYLLALAIAHEGRLATFDRGLIADAVRNGIQHLHLIG